jgi:hypothetical protein
LRRKAVRLRRNTAAQIELLFSWMKYAVRRQSGLCTANLGSAVMHCASAAPRGACTSADAARHCRLCCASCWLSHQLGALLWLQVSRCWDARTDAARVKSAPCAARIRIVSSACEKGARASGASEHAWPGNL